MSISADKRAASIAEALALLSLPNLNSLSEQQVRGAACVWDGIILAPQTAVDLGQREADRAGRAVPWFPRACRRCVHVAARLQLASHRACCELCVEEVSNCEHGFPLLQLAGEYRR